MNCPAGCGHDVKFHGAVRVAFTNAEDDYDAISCHAMTGPMGVPQVCRCCVKKQEWLDLLLHKGDQGSLFMDDID